MMELEMGQIIVVDDFYEDPQQVRELALTNGTFCRQPWRPRLCEWVEYFPEDPVDEELMLRFAEIVDANLEYEEKYQGFFRLLTEDAWSRLSVGPVIVHIDEYDWIGIIGLFPRGAGHIPFYRHKENGLSEIAGNHEWVGALISDAGDLSRWELIQEVALDFNRLVLFSPRMFHAPSAGFGSTLRDAKLTQQFQFNTEQCSVTR
jgi:hypothetical protein